MTTGSSSGADPNGRRRTAITKKRRKDALQRHSSAMTL